MTTIPNKPESPSGKPGSWRPFLGLIRSARPSTGLLSLALGLSVLTAAGGLIVPQVTRSLVDGFSLSSLHAGQIALIACLFLASAAASGLSIFLLNRIGQQVLYRLRDRLWKKMLVLPVAHYDRVKSAELVSRMTNDTGIVKNLISEHLSTLVSGSLSIVGSLILLFALDWRMTSVLLVAVPLAVAVMVPMGMQMSRISRSTQDETAGWTATLSQVLSENRLVKSSGAEPLEYEHGREGMFRLLKLGIKEGRVQAFVTPLMTIVIMMLLAVVVGYGGMRVSSGAMTTGGLVAFVLYLMQLIAPLTQLTQFFTQFQKAVGATGRIVETLAAPEEDHETGSAVPGEIRPIRLDRISFGYGAGSDVLKDVSFEVPCGKVTALVGPSGSGKTTLFSLLERYYEPSQGALRYGDENASAFSLASWRGQIGYVQQESPLISGTIRDNIVYGLDRPVSDEELSRAAAMANAESFILSFDDGYGTQVGERGLKLSGGQRQRIGIARALLRDPRILLLDEATSSLDSQSEAAVQEALANLMKGRTTIVIAHRLSTVVDADQIVFLDKGAVTGIGTHEELAKNHELYRQFAVSQLRYEDERQTVIL
ncbi:ABC transporter ATP-binding protein [Cohnella sp. CBP 2801]|uniref:ABC transporter ATP-binding protein n=2 Tax=Cohnella zeiphila TaxID=2761120 RepID=A0A7X0SHY2_9BACL|nr:ABC transporter ATP-binding protein [Cohnella zeiphila]